MKKFSLNLMNWKFFFSVLLVISIAFLIKLDYSVKNTKQFTLFAYGYNPTHLNYPLDNSNKIKAFNKVAKKWSINFKYLECSLTTDTLQYINKTNIINELKLMRKYGLHWEEKFLNEVKVELCKKN